MVFDYITHIYVIRQRKNSILAAGSLDIFAFSILTMAPALPMSPV